MLEATEARIGEERSTRDPLEEREVKALLRQVSTVVLARGKKAEQKPAKEVRPDDLRGPTGNFRAPIVRRGKTLLVGFHEESLRKLL